MPVCDAPTRGSRTQSSMLSATPRAFSTWEPELGRTNRRIDTSSHSNHPPSCGASGLRILLQR
jgi:hypothetical protein